MRDTLSQEQRLNYLVEAFKEDSGEYRELETPKDAEGNLQAGEASADQGGDKKDDDRQQAEGQVDQDRGAAQGQDPALRQRAQGQDQERVDDVRAEDVADGQGALALDNS